MEKQKILCIVRVPYYDDKPGDQNTVTFMEQLKQSLQSPQFSDYCFIVVEGMVDDITFEYPKNNTECVCGDYEFMKEEQWKKMVDQWDTFKMPEVK